MAGVCLAVCLPALSAGACGRKGPPLPPLSRVPDAVSEIQARRVGDDVYVRLVVPAQNVDASGPADLARVDVLAVTSDRPLAPETFVKVAEQIASVPVARVEPDAGNAPRPDATAAVPGARQGTSITVRERLDGGKLTPIPAPEPAAPSAEAPSKPDPDTGEAATRIAGPRRYYMAVAYSARNRSVTRGAQASVSVALPPPAPERLDVSYTQESMTLSWNAPSGATSYNVYRDEASADTAPPPPSWDVVPPAPVNATPLTASSFEEPVAFGRERCYRVRSVRAEEGSFVDGPLSARVCRTPEDTFPPRAPAELAAAAAAEGIALRWAPNTEPDLGGYLILRGRPGDATLLPITPTPIAQTQFVDREVMSGLRYVYAVVAVDTRTPAPNRSPESQRDEATAP
jgi:hypothetical protein